MRNSLGLYVSNVKAPPDGRRRARAGRGRTDECVPDQARVGAAVRAWRVVSRPTTTVTAPAIHAVHAADE